MEEVEFSLFDEWWNSKQEEFELLNFTPKEMAQIAFLEGMESAAKVYLKTELERLEKNLKK